MSDQLFVTGLRIHAKHGVHAHEAEIGQAFVLDLTIDADLSEAASADRLSATCSYDDVIATVTAAFTGARFRLIEAAAGAVADALLARFPRLDTVSVTVRKPHAPVAAIFDEVGVTLRRARNG